MTKMSWSRCLTAVLILPAAIVFSPNAGRAQTSSPAALTGEVSSQEEGRMEGVLVSARKESSTITVTVVSDAQGRYSFPRTKLDAGRYTLKIRVAGYDLKDPGIVEIPAQQATRLDLKLTKTKDLAAQLSNTEWYMSWPGTPEQKMTASNPHQAPFPHLECIGCHTVERIARSHYTANDFVEVMARMRTKRGWAWGQPPRPPSKQRAGGRMAPQGQDKLDEEAYIKDATEFFSSINLSKTSTWEYPLKTLPRPKGRATRVIITEYDLPRPDASPHDAVVAPDGTVWYGDFVEQYLGKLDPKTGKAVEYRVPEVDPGFNPGFNDIEVDKQGIVWIALFNERGLARFDPNTEKFQTWTVPSELDTLIRRTVFLAPLNHFVDGKVWLGGGHDRTSQIDIASGKWTIADEAKDMPEDAKSRRHGNYGLASDSKNNVYEMEIESEYITKVDAKTMKATYYRTPTIDSAPRRGHIDSEDRLWFAEHIANKIGLFDTKTEKFQEWTVPTPMSTPYDAVGDKNGEVWAGGESSDRIVRLNPKTGEMTEYLMPQPTNVRRVDVDNSTTPVTFWVGNNDAASIIKVEPLD